MSKKNKIILVNSDRMASEPIRLKSGRFKEKTINIVSNDDEINVFEF